jgi:hypothetical protein
MPRGISPEREKEYEELVGEFQEEHRYPGREKEVASRIVNKQRAEHGETKEAEKEDKEGKSPDKSLPMDGYDKLTVAEIAGRLDELDKAAVKKLKRYEQEHGNRKTLIERFDRRL